MNLEKLLDKIIEFSFYLLFFLVPLIMTPWNYELFEYNKMMLTYALTVIIVGTWLIKMVINKKILLCRTPFDIPLILFFVFQFLSFLFSLDRHTSFWGYYSRFHGGLLSTISYILLYYALVSNFDKQKVLNSVKVLLISATLVTLYGIAEHFGIDAKYWVQDVRNRVFSTLGQPNWLAAWIAALLPIPLALLFIQKKNKSLSLFYSFTLLLFLLNLFFTKSRSGIPAALLGLGFFAFLLMLQKISSLRKQLLLPIILVFIVGSIGISTLGLKFLFKNTTQDLAYILDLTDKVFIPIHEVQLPGSESGDIRKVVWRGAVKIFKAYPLFGSGIETFAYSYYQFRPVEHNWVSEWDFLYNKAHNEYFNFLATTGAFGLGSYLLLIGWIIGWNIKKIFNFQFSIFNQFPNSNNQKKIGQLEIGLIIAALFSGWLSILITNFFGFSVVPVALLFFLYPAFVFILTQTEEEKVALHSGGVNVKHKQFTPSVSQYATSSLILFFIFYFLFFISRLWYADTLYARGGRLSRQGFYNDAFTNLQEAVKINPSEPTYRDEFAYISSALAVLATAEKQNDLANQLINLALSQSDQALKTSPKHLNFYRTRAKIYFNLARINPAYLQEALATLQKASQLAPTEPKILYNTGLVYYQLGQKEKAIGTIRKALELKPSYPEAQMALDLIRKETGK